MIGTPFGSPTAYAAQLNPLASLGASGGATPFPTQTYGQLQPYLPIGGPGMAISPWGTQSQQYLQPLQQVLQLLQIVPQQLQQLQQLQQQHVQQLQQLVQVVPQQLQQLQQLVQIVPQQLQQLQQLIQFVPQQIQQLQHQLQAQQQPFGQPPGLPGFPISPQFAGSLGWAPAQGTQVM